MTELPSPINSLTIQTPTADSSLDEWLTYLENLHTKAIDLGLARAKKVATALDLLKPAPKIITVAGTNGKGTTCRALEIILLDAGFRVGVYNSPHLIRYNERVRIQGKELNDKTHSNAFSFIQAGRKETSLSYFEFGTLAALHLFKEAQLDIVILEIGLGGRLDSCNIIDPDVAVITSIDIDHIDWLGDNREDIAREKAGIFRKNKPAVVGEPNIPDSLYNVAEQVGAPVYAVGQSWYFTAHLHNWSWFGADLQLKELPYPNIPVQNAATALACLYYAGLLNVFNSKSVLHSKLQNSLAKTALTGRFQCLEYQTNDKTLPKIIVDVAHNPHAAKYLAQQLIQLKAKLPLFSKCHLVIGMLADKDIQNTLAKLLPVVDYWYFADLNVPRGTDANSLAKHLSVAIAQSTLYTKTYTPQFNTSDSVISAYQKAINTFNDGDLVIICGSFYTVAELLQWHENSKDENK